MSEQVSNQQINDAGHLTIGGVDALELAQQYQTPLAVYDVSKIRDQIRRFKSVFEDNGVDYAVTYASKAFATIAMYQVVDQEGAHIDVVSGGELYTALQAHFPAANISSMATTSPMMNLKWPLKITSVPLCWITSMKLSNSVTCWRNTMPAFRL